MLIVKLGLLYFGLVFGAGFGLGIIRTVWLVPWLGVRWAELLEMPFMLMVIIAAAQWILKTSPIEETANRDYLGVGMIALACLLMAETAVGMGLRGMTITQALLDRDPISGTAYYLLLLIYAFLPWAWAKRL